MAKDDYISIHGTVSSQTFQRTVTATKAGRAVKLVTLGKWYVLQELTSGKRVVHEIKALVKDVSLIERGFRN